MPAFFDDPELVATFRAEVDDRLQSLSSGLLRLEREGNQRSLIAALFRDAHTVKGSASMLGLDRVLDLAHHAEDLLGALRDGRFAVRRDLVDLLLVTCDALGRAIPGSDPALSEPDATSVLEALAAAVAGVDPVRVPSLALPEPEEGSHAGESDGSGDPRPRGDTIRIGATKVYDLLDVVGEAELDARRCERMVSTLVGLSTEHGRLVKALHRAGLSVLDPDLAASLHRAVTLADELDETTGRLRELTDDARGRLAQVREGAMGLAMVPVRRVLGTLPRLVREVSARTGREVRLVLEGEDVELDKQVLDGIAEPLRHLVTNAVDHGCETPDERRAVGKAATATVTVRARAAGGTVVIEVADDGRGVDEESVRRSAVTRGLLPPDSTASGPALLSLLFAPGFSTRSEVTETSGRGVGLDVVRQAVEDLGGAVSIGTDPGAGTTFTVTLPLTLGVLRCLIARVGEERYAIPVPSVVESVALRDLPVHDLGGVTMLVRHGETLPLLDLGAALGVPGERQPRAAILVRYAGGEQLAWAVDRLEGELELVVKDLGPFLGRLPLVSGATIDGDGVVVCLVDLRELGGAATRPALTGVDLPAPRDAEAPARRRVLVCEDSLGVRELERAVLEAAGYEVTACVDGLDGAAHLRGAPYDLVLTDVEMPGMDGFALTRTIRSSRGWEQVPVVVMTSRGDEADRRAGLEAGANAYLLKSEFNQEQLVATVRRLLGS